MYTEINYAISEVGMRRAFGKLSANASDFRALMAQLSDVHKAGLPEELFHYSQGRPADGLSPVRFSVHPRGMRLIGIGLAGREIVTASAPIIQRLLMKATKTIIMFNVSSGSNKIKLTGAPLKYHASTIVIGDYKSRHQWRKWQSHAESSGLALLDIPEARAKAEQRLAASLRRQLVELHDGPGDMTCIDATTGVETDDAIWNRLNINIVSIIKLGSVPSFGQLQSIHARAQFAEPQGALTLIRPIIEINAKLEGHWGVGLLQARGHGLLWPHWVEQELQVAA